MTPIRSLVTVVGGSLAGWASAVALASRGVRVVLYEEMPYTEQETGFLEIVPNMLRDLVRLGVADECIRAGFPYRGFDVVGRTGQVSQGLPIHGLAGPRLPAAVGISDRAFRSVLESAACRLGVSVRRGVAVAAIEQASSRMGEQAVVRLKDGTFCVADLVVLAVDARSPLRQAVFSAATPPRATGQVWLRTIVSRPTQISRPQIGLLGKGQHLAVLPIRGDRIGVVLGMVAARAADVAGGAELREALKQWGELSRQVSDRTPVWLRDGDIGVLEEPWHRGVVLAVGSCAHLLPPQFGQHPAQAVEDAIVLGDLVTSAPSVQGLLQRFDERRQARVRAVFDLVMTAVGWNLEPSPQTDLNRLQAELMRIIEVPA